jgi:uncharacterized protein YqgC (DUF456 family)
MVLALLAAATIFRMQRLAPVANIYLAIVSVVLMNASQLANEGVKYFTDGLESSYQATMAGTVIGCICDLTLASRRLPPPPPLLPPPIRRRCLSARSCWPHAAVSLA